ncbi:unnamed protein product [Closterium sp. NIES-64]|nr:unnamed protein product [Closterium sp. NIES-64]
MARISCVHLPYLAVLYLLAFSAMVEALPQIKNLLGASFAQKRTIRRTTDDGARARGIDFSRIVQLSAWKPRAYLYRNFLTDDECDHIIKIATPRLQRSSVADNTDGHSELSACPSAHPSPRLCTPPPSSLPPSRRRSSVADNTDGHSELSSIRTSSGMFIAVAEDAVIARIEARIAQWTFLPLPNQEAMQVLRYEKGQKYEPHVDYFHDPNNRKRGGHRYATVLMYLNNVTKGGETVFPTADDPSPKDDSWTECAKGKLAVKPSKGDALLFYSMHPDGSPDPSSLALRMPRGGGGQVVRAQVDPRDVGIVSGWGSVPFEWFRECAHVDAGAYVGGVWVVSGQGSMCVSCAFVSGLGSMCVCEWTGECAHVGGGA